jgi:hypothetical protein
MGATPAAPILLTHKEDPLFPAAFFFPDGSPAKVFSTLKQIVQGPVAAE